MSTIVSTFLILFCYFKAAEEKDSETLMNHDVEIANLWINAAKFSAR